MSKPDLYKFSKKAELVIQKYERYLPTAFDESLTIIEKMNMIIEYLNRVGVLVGNVVNQWNEVMRWIVDDGLAYEVNKKLQEMVDDGTLHEIINIDLFNAIKRDIQNNTDSILDLEEDYTQFKKDVNENLVTTIEQLLEDIESFKDELRQETLDMVAGIQINVKDYGVVGDGVTNDFDKIKEVMEYARLKGFTIYFPSGNYLMETTTRQVILIPKMLGDMAHLDLKGEIMFKATDSILVDGFKVTLTKPELLDENSMLANSDYSFLGVVDIDKEVEYVKIKNIHVKINALKTQRLKNLFYLPTAPFTEIDNIRCNNVVIAISGLRNSENISINNVYCENTETLVFLKNPIRARLTNLEIKNVKEDSKWWVQKGQGRNLNGRDVILTEEGRDITIENIRGEWCIERVIYSQSTNVTARNLKSVNTGGFKFVGEKEGIENRVRNIRVFDIDVLRTDDNVHDSMGQVYGCHDITFTNCIFRSTIGDANVNYHSISGNNGTVTFQNVYMYGFREPMFKKLAGITNTLILKNLNYISSIPKTIDGLIMVKDVRYFDSSAYINRLIVDGFFSNIPDDFIPRNLFYNPVDNKLANNISLSNANHVTTGVGNHHMYGVESLLGVEYEKVSINSIGTMNFLSSTMYNRNLISDRKISDFRIKKTDGSTQCEILINKPTTDSVGILTYIDTIKYTDKASNDSSFTFPAKASDSWNIKVGHNYGYAEFSTHNGELKEIANITNLTELGSGTPSPDKLTIFINEGYIAVRNRISSNKFTVKLEKLI